MASASRTASLIAICAFAVLLVFGAVAAFVFLVMSADDAGTAGNATEPTTTSPQPESDYAKYRYAAVTTNSHVCSKIGLDVMMRLRGSAVDVAIATTICLGVTTSNSNGIGGGHFSTIYERPRGENDKVIKVVFGRERAPAFATEDMFVSNPTASTVGGLAIGVPGEIRGFYEAWKMFGRVDWAALFEPSIRLLEKGFEIEPSVVVYVKWFEDSIRRDANLRHGAAVQCTKTVSFTQSAPEPSASATGSGAAYLGAQNRSRAAEFFTDCIRLITREQGRTGPPGYLALARELFVKADGNLVEAGDVVTNPKLARTFRRIAENPFAFYNGSLAQDIVDDVKDYGGNITLADLEGYVSTIKDPLQMTLTNGEYTLYNAPPPASGSIISFILAILDGYQMTENSVSDTSTTVLTYHRIVEAFKFAYAKRSHLADEDFVDVAELVHNLTSLSYAESIRAKIDDSRTRDVFFYEPTFVDHGTNHINVLTPDGSAVALTTTINYPFGARARGSRTGIIFNNEMDDFSTPGVVNLYGFPASRNNFVEPGKMPMSSMCPTIVFDSSGNVVYLAGGSGGSRITTTTAFVMMNSLWFKKDLKAATDTARIHHQLMPERLDYEASIDEDVLHELVKKGHNATRERKTMSIVNSIRVKCDSTAANTDPYRTQYCVEAVADWRKADGVEGV